MRIGLSFSRCVLDIVEGKVDIDDVLIIIARTDFNPTDDKHWDAIWHGYATGNGLSAPEWAYTKHTEEEFRNVTLELYNEGKLHQPRQFGKHPVRRSEIWLEAVLPSEELEHNPAAKQAWDRFQVIAGLTNVSLNKDIY